MPSSFGSIENARVVIGELAERYRANRDRYESSTYNEETARNEFINPLFEALGWDISNKASAAEQYKDVIHEEGIKVGDYTKAPDYTFRFGGIRKFFVEAKKPFVDLKSDPAPAFQLRRYAWSAKLPLSILTDFEEFVVYDTRIKPRVGDKASVGRILYFTFDELLSKLEEIWGIFSKDAVLKGSFDRYADATLGKRGTSEVDAEFLKDIEGWREDLAKNLALRNEDLTEDDLNFAVQTTIDRIIFMRIAEGRGAEGYGGLLGLTNGPNIYKRLVEVYRKADHRYNSGLFDFTTDGDRLTPGLAIDDKVLKPILTALYYPQSPYEFSVLPAEILGNVYEQFLGKVIRLTKGHRAVIEEKPEVKKAGGVYYTPSYIVDYIVDQTVGALTEGKSPKQMEKLRILDPACGSGSFLIVAYQHLLDEHLTWYQEHEPQKHKKEVFLGPGGWRLTTAEKRRILLNNIYGVDIDRQAVEVTKLSLLLKVMEGENNETLTQQSLFGERALPSLEQNIKCGNSLISPEDMRGDLFPNADEVRRVNPFNWKRGFVSIFSGGGFDVVIGNPPYLKIEHIPDSDRVILGKSYKSLQKRFDTYGLFVELSTRLLKPDGTLGFIIPSTILNNLSFTQLRKLLLEDTRILEIVNLGGRVFRNANNDTLILVAAKGAKARFKTAVRDVEAYGAKLEDAVSLGNLDLPGHAKAPDFTFQLRVDSDSSPIFDKMAKTGIHLGQISDCFQGLVTGGNDAYIVAEDEMRQERLETAVCKRAIFGDEVSRYEPPRPGYRVIYLTRTSDLDAYPNVRKRLLPFKHQLEKKREVKLGRQPWFALHWARNQANFERKEKILVQAIRNLSLKRRVVATLDTEQLYADHTLNILYSTDSAYDLRFALGILNSQLINFWFLKRHIDINIKGVYLEAVPLPAVDFTSAVSKNRYQRVIRLVEAMLTGQRSALRSRTPHDVEAAKRQLDAIDVELNRLICEMYGLSPEEIEVVETEALSWVKKSAGKPE